MGSAELPLTFAHSFGQCSSEQVGSQKQLGKIFARARTLSRVFGGVAQAKKRVAKFHSQPHGQHEQGRAAVEEADPDDRRRGTPPSLRPTFITIAKIGKRKK